MARRKRPFARARQWSNGKWYAETRVGMCSGPWDHEHQAQGVADLWNEAVKLPN